VSREEISQKISHGNISFWEKKTEKFLDGNPTCSSCGDELTSFSRTGLCWKCRCRKNYQAFLRRNPGYEKRYAQERNIK